MPRTLKEFKRLQEEALLLDGVALGHREGHVEKSVLVGILVVILLKDLLVGKDLGLWWRELSRLLKSLLQCFKRTLVLGKRLALGNAHLFCKGA